MIVTRTTRWRPAVGLILYGVTTEKELQGVAGQPPDDERFKRQLTGDKYGVPAAIRDMLFGEYVAGKSGPGLDDLAHF